MKIFKIKLYNPFKRNRTFHLQTIGKIRIYLFKTNSTSPIAVELAANRVTNLVFPPTVLGKV